MAILRTFLFGVIQHINSCSDSDISFSLNISLNSVFMELVGSLFPISSGNPKRQRLHLQLCTSNHSTFSVNPVLFLPNVTHYVSNFMIRLLAEMSSLMVLSFLTTSLISLMIALLCYLAHLPCHVVPPVESLPWHYSSFV